MSTGARTNGWRGFEGIGRKVSGGWMFTCDGMPRLSGCGEQIIVPRRWTKVGKKKSGWVVMYGLEPNTPKSDLNDPNQLREDHDVVLCFCPSCAAVVAEQAAS